MISSQIIDVDLEWAEIHNRQPLDYINPNDQAREQKRKAVKEESDPFAIRLRSAVEFVSGLV